ncbi:ATP synthase regulation protein NCA2-domain-containing protein [Elsinoe ampelina]|uniref:ATP synthase regulation protein NCA2-domain-containing protein n=1 Tax=Elsinoe ampelina TaxID=302913 RepID=A0A6A6GGP3_9PEZI|nr:ATP synthase regulation protein NCA2-domain-containing protein [Elsinoe ampelina]
MSFVLDQVQRIDAALDRLSLQSSTAGFSTTGTSRPQLTRETQQLQSLVKSLSVDPSSSRLLSASRIRHLLSEAQLDHVDTASAEQSEFEHELQWLAVSKAVAQTYGLVIDRLLQQTVSIADDVYYWDDVLTSYSYTLLYSIQTSPLRLYDFGSQVWTDVRERMGQDTITQQWKRFYGLVRQVVSERRALDIQSAVVSPVARLRSEIRAKQRKLKQARLRGANALGVLLGEGLMNECVHGDGLATPAGEYGGRKWKASVARNVALIDAVLNKVNSSDLEVDKFDAAIAEETDEDLLYAADMKSNGDPEAGLGVHPSMVAERLMALLDSGLSTYDNGSKTISTSHGKPNKLIRYWFPAAIAILSSSTVLRILINRQAEITQWVEEFGATVIDFWSNWVVEPTRKLIKTIRHDEGSEVAIMSKRSLEGDRESLERMVVDFARENPANVTGSATVLTEAELADIRLKVREGDLTPVLKAYEKDLASPFMGAVRGNLIRALLIQVQKTKVDVEVAMGGIDALLKSQELVFGFVGLTPGILVTVALFRWGRSSFGSRKGSDRQKKKGVMVRQLRNIDRVLSNSNPTNFGELYYKDQGLLLCEVHVLRQEAKRSMPDNVYREFCEEVEELVDVRSGVKRQIKVVERMRWAYARWF